ncbi:dTDP-4-dehydrorhamnose reductase [Kineobactrum salinum]|uniref:dTDP-4-dehydrorhamnose reductase n=1 Tax=Kineobactrum salinum TaxID=2708301 RepID=A0A6C0U0Q9_9GAMM|nr:dTDP-4-dehydrorhamnose reductase [Kineobactrum salinum]QIB65702.1 dTDP-4-dehydrorhamnose reductase [Kineobactrum salinum]
MATTVVIAGADGQLGRELQCTAPTGVRCLGLNRTQLDITDPASIHRCLQELQPAWLLNAAAYTAVDRAEQEEALALQVNAEGAANLATACAERDIRLLQVSTDFVFSGESGRPYQVDAPPEPLGAYGRSKLAGEQAVVSALPEVLILRTGWVYSRFGSNFVKTMLRLMGERDALSVVCDQVGTPTWGRGLAQAAWAAVARPQLHGIYHWSDAGVCSWYDFAVAIAEEGLAGGLLSHAVTVTPIPSSDYPTPARRPAFSVLDKQRSWRDLGLPPHHWRVQLRAMLQDLKDNGHE